MFNTYKTLALEIIQKNSSQKIKQLEAYLLDPQKVDYILDAGRECSELMFVSAQILGKAILRGQFLALNQTRSQDGESDRSCDLQRLRVYSGIMSKVFNHIVCNNLMDYLGRSCINLVTLCMKGILESSLQVKLSNTLLQQYIGIILPGFCINQQFTNNYTGSTMILQIKHTNIPDGFKVAMKVLSSLMEYITTNAYFKSYYDFRRNIYTFRNSHLPIMLNISVQYIKILFTFCENNKWTINDQLLQNLSQALTLLDSVFMFPFTLSLHQYDQELESNDNMSARGKCTEIYFPNYFRNVLADRNFISNLSRYYSVLMAICNVRLKQDLSVLVRIIGRMVSCSSYCFNSDEEKASFRSDAITISMMLANECRLDDSYLLSCISEILIRILNTYSDTDFKNLKPLFLEGTIRFSSLIVDIKIVLSQGKRNGFCWSLQMASECLNQCRDCANQQVIRHGAQDILQKVYRRISDNEQTLYMMKELGQNNPNEVQVFEELFFHILTLFKRCFDTNVLFMLSVDLSKLAIPSRIFWLHFASMILPLMEGKAEHTKLVVKYFQLAKDTPGLASLHFIQSLVDLIMQEMEEGISITPLWKTMESLTNQSFDNFILFALKSCFNCFTIASNTILDYSLSVFKSIYLKLKKNDKPQFKIFYGLVMELVSNMSGTVFVNPKFFKKRLSLFSVISIIWVNTAEIKYTYQIYELILKQIREDNSILGLMKYMVDLTGLFESIQIPQPFQILAELTVRDLAILLPQHLSITKMKNIFSELQYVKIFLNLVFQLCNDQFRRLTLNSHNKLPFLLQQLFYPYLISVLQYQLPPIIIPIWAKFIHLNPLSELLPLTKSLKQLDSSQYEGMIREYFSNLYRCTNLEQLYQHIQGNVQWMSEWWEQIIERKLMPNINMHQVVEARIWTTRRQREIFAKMLYAIGRYNSNYWGIGPNYTERIFVNEFMERYNG